MKNLNISNRNNEEASLACDKDGTTHSAAEWEG